MHSTQLPWMTKDALRITTSAMVLCWILLGCATVEPPAPETPGEVAVALETAKTHALFGDSDQFLGSSLESIGKSELYPARESDECEVAMLESGEGSFAARLDMIKNARQSIRIQALIFSGDESGHRVAEILKKKKADGLDVRVIIDGVSNPGWSTQMMYFDLQQNGIPVQGYEALGLEWINEIPTVSESEEYDAGKLDKRLHEKIWLVDAGTPWGEGITGGLNIANEYFRIDPQNPDDYWRDQDVAVRGEILNDLAMAFDHTFDYLQGIKESRGIFNTDPYWKATLATMEKTGKLKINRDFDPRLEQRVQQLEQASHPLVYHPAQCRFFHNRPRFAETYILQAYLMLMAEAETELLIANAYFVPTPILAAALKETAKRCVAVTLVTNSPDTNDLPEISMVGRGYYKDLLTVNSTPEVEACKRADAGLHIWEWVGKAPGDPVQQGTMHSKFAVADRALALVGSYNFDPRSERLNSETALIFRQPEIAQELAHWILDRDLRYSHEVSPEDAAAYADPEDTIYRWRERIGHLFEDEL